MQCIDLGALIVDFVGQHIDIVAGAVAFGLHQAQLLFKRISFSEQSIIVARCILQALLERCDTIFQMLNGLLRLQIQRLGTIPGVDHFLNAHRHGVYFAMVCLNHLAIAQLQH